MANRPVTANEWLFQQLRSKIISGEYEPGAVMRQEEIASRYDVSRMPVREAMRRLEAEGLVEQRPHRGVIVADLDADDAYDLFQIRAYLESYAARRSVPLLSDEQISEVRAAEAAMNKASGDALIERHRDFHLSIYAAAGQRLRRMIREQIDAAQRYHLRFGRREMEVSTADRREHRKLVKAAEKRDGDTASEILFKHVADGGKAISNSIKKRVHKS